MQIIAIIILINVIIGFFPKITALLHLWIVQSFLKGSVIVEGGDQIAAILCLLILPIAILDKRRNHWIPEHITTNIFTEYISFSCLIMCKLQMSILYFDAAIQKIKVKEWVDGTAVYYWFNDSTFGAVGIWHYLFNWLFTSALTAPIMSWGVMVFELLLGCGLVMNTQSKYKLFYFAVAFHLSIIAIHGLFSFFFAMLGGLILYLLPLNFSIQNILTYTQWNRNLQTN